ncbi:MAG: response regulator [Planctomycetes bacterium]|nr:response regulator [Planctomycetota bacterium]
MSGSVSLSSGTPDPVTGCTRSPEEPTVLVVDDSALDRHKAGSIIGRNLGWKITFAANGRLALEAIHQARPSLVLTDLQMPEMDGLELIEALRDRYPGLPVVLMSAHGSEEITLQALRRGAASYVPKRCLAQDLTEILQQVQAAAEAEQQQQRLLAYLQEVECSFALANDPVLIRALVARLQKDLSDLKLCDEGRRLRAGIALEEAMTNAMFHGNLEVASELRQQGDGRAYRQLADERRVRPPYRDRRIYVQACLSGSRAVFVIRDEGPGFDPAAVPDPLFPENMEKASGRGLLLIRTFMDEVSFNAAGNQITLVLRPDQSSESGR